MNADTVHKDVCWAFPTYAVRKTRACAGAPTDTCMDNTQVQTQLWPCPASQVKARRVALHKQRYQQTSVSHHRGGHLLILACRHSLAWGRDPPGTHRKTSHAQLPGSQAQTSTHRDTLVHRHTL